VVHAELFWLINYYRAPYSYCCNQQQHYLFGRHQLNVHLRELARLDLVDLGYAYPGGHNHHRWRLGRQRWLGRGQLSQRFCFVWWIRLFFWWLFDRQRLWQRILGQW
jgi:hypothetical protein